MGGNFCEKLERSLEIIFMALNLWRFDRDYAMM